MEKIDFFRGKYAFLSNFYEIPVEYDGRIYANSEGAFHSMKCLDIKSREKFKNLNPSEAKKLGRSVVLRSDWDSVKDSIMKEIIRAKFEQNEEIGKLLIETGNTVLIEGNWWGDRYWGVCNGTGQNKLGKILMEIRTELKSKKLF
jgi:ribA/ribD-fused uncharacterized protein